MVLDQYVRDLKAFMDEFATALEAERTKLYLDTSVLIWLIRLGATARAEILAWFRNRPANTVWVPVWAGHELHRHILDNTARKNLNDAVSDLTAKYDDFVRMVAERADDSVCITKGYQSRSSFITELELTSVRLDRLVKVAALDDKPLQVATKEVIDFANERMLSTDLSPIVKKLDRSGEFRVSHLMPPAFQDKKEKNAYGDMVIWEEIIKDIRSDEKAGESRDVVFISRDKKTDWVSAAPYVLGLSAGIGENVEISVIQ
jgi:PIN like domain